MLFQNKEKQANKELAAVGERWLKEMSSIAPNLLGNKYSNPYYLALPDKWFSSKQRILIVVEDGFGFEGNGKYQEIKPNEIKKIQDFTLDWFHHYVSNADDGEHDFWYRARAVCLLGKPVAFTSLNMFSMRHAHRSKPSDADRKLMHSGNIRILKEEIDIAKPTHIFFFGWYGDSLKTELPDVHHCLYPRGDDDSSLWIDSFADFTVNGVYYLFSYNPYSPYWKKKPSDYEDQILKALKAHLNISASEQRNANKVYKEDPKPNNTVQEPRETSNSAISEALDNPVVGIAASYALGKTVQNANERAANKVISRLEKNRQPFSETLKEHDWASGHRIPFSRNTCYTCAYWNGERKIERDCILIPQNVPSAKCSKTVGTIYVAKSNCRNWKPLK